VLGPWLQVDPDAVLPGRRARRDLARLRGGAASADASRPADGRRGVKRTKAGTIVVAVAIGVFLGFAVDQVLTATGRPTFTPSFLLPILLVLLGIALVLFALPIRRAIRARPAPVDPFRAVRVAMLAKASTLVGAGSPGSRRPARLPAHAARRAP
jgi:hypothetical protein